jgi:transposase
MKRSNQKRITKEAIILRHMRMEKGLSLNQAWTRAMIATLIRRKYGIRLSLASVGRLLAQLGLSCQKPLVRAFQQNPTLVKQWVENDYPKIRAQAKRENAERCLLL